MRALAALAVAVSAVLVASGPRRALSAAPGLNVVARHASTGSAGTALTPLVVDGAVAPHFDPATFGAAPPASPFEYEQAPRAALATRTGQRAVWAAQEASTNLTWGLGPSGRVPGALAPEEWGGHLSCNATYEYTALVTLFFGLSDERTGALDVVRVAFAWPCRPDRCSGSNCSGHGTCRGGLCVCDAGYVGESCEALWQVASASPCPGVGIALRYGFRDTDAYRVSFTVPNTTDDGSDWVYLATGSRRERPASSSAPLAGSYTWCPARASSPGPVFVALYLGNDSLPADNQTVTIRGWGECGYGQPQRCPYGRYWWDCSRGCVNGSVATVRNRSGVLANDHPPAGLAMAYPASVVCTWLLAPDWPASNNQRFTLDFALISLDLSDHLKLIWGSSADEKREILKGELEGKTLVVHARQLYSDGSIAGKGFVLSYTTHSDPPLEIILSTVFSFLVGGVCVVAAAACCYFRRRKRKFLVLPPAEVLSPADERELLRVDASIVDAEVEHMTGVGGSPPVLAFGLQAKAAFPVGAELTETIRLRNSTGSSVPFRVYVPDCSSVLALSVQPSQGSIPARGTADVSVRATLLYTTRLRRVVKVALGGGLARYLAFAIDAEGALSDRLDPEEIEIQAPPLSSGAHGTVYRGMYRERVVAVKVIASPAEDAEDVLEDFHREISLYKSMRCPYIADFIGACFKPDKLCFCTELLEIGSLDRVLHHTTTELPFVLQVKFALNISEAMAFLHSNDVMFRDLKPANVLVASLNPRTKANCKLIDFGCARTVANASEIFDYTVGVGTLAYMAPELLAPEPYNKMVDVFAYGVTLWEIVTRQEPWKDVVCWSIPCLTLGGHRLPLPQDLIGDLGPVIQACWCQYPANRPEFREVSRVLAEFLNDEYPDVLDSSVSSSIMADSTSRKDGPTSSTGNSAEMDVFRAARSGAAVGTTSSAKCSLPVSPRECVP
eukprot:m51a1_g1907 putative protein kinase domain containing protein (956) ;mRNA; r:793753-796930